ncbi:membrane protein [Capnocytophaga canimorsus]|nr:membrane protein [Capnocytophaga canimorsus]
MNNKNIALKIKKINYIRTLNIKEIIMKGKSILIMGLAVAFVACNQQNKQTTNINSLTKQENVENQPFLKQMEYSNLVDKASQEEVKQALANAGIAQANIEIFFENVNYFNNLVGDVGLVQQGFSTSDNLTPKYDQVSVIERWDKKHPTFPGYNCRITSLDLLRDFVEVKEPKTNVGLNLFVDNDALENNPKRVFSEREKEVFMNLYTNFPTPYVSDTQKHIENARKTWKEKGITFPHKNDRAKASLISVFFHSAITPEESELFVGHVGVLVPTTDNKLIFIEKLSFQEPYQAVKFNNRTELNDFLMHRYDVEWNQPTSIPFIFENDDLLEGYRPNENKVKQ